MISYHVRMQFIDEKGNVDRNVYTGMSKFAISRKSSLKHAIWDARYKYCHDHHIGSNHAYSVNITSVSTVHISQAGSVKKSRIRFRKKQKESVKAVLNSTKDNKGLSRLEYLQGLYGVRAGQRMFDDEKLKAKKKLPQQKAERGKNMVKNKGKLDDKKLILELKMEILKLKKENERLRNRKK